MSADANSSSSTKRPSSSMGYVRLDVGHNLYTCHRDTLTKFDQTVLAKLISPEFDTRLSEQDYIVIDRDGKHFGVILNYLRDHTSFDVSAYSYAQLQHIAKEADYYCLGELARVCQQELDKLQKFESRRLDRLKTSTFSIVFGKANIMDVLRPERRLCLVANVDKINALNLTNCIELLVALCCEHRVSLFGYKSSESDSLEELDNQLVVLDMVDDDDQELIEDNNNNNHPAANRNNNNSPRDLDLSATFSVVHPQPGGLMRLVERLDVSRCMQQADLLGALLRLVLVITSDKQRRTASA